MARLPFARKGIDAPPALKVYIAGPMSKFKDTDWNYPTFNRAAAAWRKRGWTVFNPAENYGGDTTRVRAEYIKADLPMVIEADAIALLPGWEESVGARHEVLTAILMDKAFFNAETFEILPTPDVRSVVHTYHPTGVRFKREDTYSATPTDAGVRVLTRQEEPTSAADATTDDMLRVMMESTVQENMRPKEGTWETKPVGADGLVVPDFVGRIDGGGVKQVMKEMKCPIEFIPPQFINGLAEVLKYGAKKYARHNWMRGMSWETVAGAVMRHFNAFRTGEEVDPETGLSHLYHAAFGLMVLSWYAHGPQNDDHRQFDDRVFTNSKPGKELGADRKATPTL